MSRIVQNHASQIQSLTGQVGTPTAIIVADRTGGFIWDRQAVLHAISPYHRSPYHGAFHSLSSRQQQILSSRSGDVEITDLFPSEEPALGGGDAGHVSSAEPNQGERPAASKSDVGSKLKPKPKKAARFAKAVNRA